MFRAKNPAVMGKLSTLLSNIDLPTLWNMSRLHQVVLGLLSLDLSTELRKMSHCSHINVTDTMGRTPLHWAAHRADYDAMQTLLLAGADRQRVDSEGRTPLHLASASGDIKCVKILVLGGIQVNVSDLRGDSPMLVAAWGQDEPGIIRLLASVGGDVMCRNANGVTALQSAACLNHPNNIREFLDLGADPNAFDQNGDTPLFETIYYECKEAMEVLVGQHIDVSHCNRKGWNLLHVLALYGTVETFGLVRHLLGSSELAQQDSMGRMPIEALRSRTVVEQEFLDLFTKYLANRDDTSDATSEDSFVTAPQR